MSPAPPSPLTPKEDPLWTPHHPANTQTEHFRQRINEKYALHLESYEQLWRWSCDERAAFWNEIWDWGEVVGDKGSGQQVVDEMLSPADNPPWFTGSSLNWAENQLKYAKSRPDDIAIIQISEPCPSYSPSTIRLSQAELYNLVSRAQKTMKANGVKKGDRVAFWGGNCIEAVVVLLATSSLGGIFSSAAADFGVDGVIERLQQIRPKLLFLTNGVVYGATARPLLPLLPTLLASLDSPPEQTIIIDHLPTSIVPPLAGSLQTTNVHKWDEYLDPNSGEVEFVRMGFDEPIWILFSSGTTGKPKAIVSKHRQGGMLLDSIREHTIAGDMTRGDVFFYYTTPGWMMFQYLVSGLSTGATIVLYEGSPLKRPEMMWDTIDTLGVTIFGTSAKWIEQISKHYPNVKSNHSLSTLRQILSTGSPLPPQLFDFVYQNVKSDILLGSISGGTDVCSAFLSRCTSLPVYRGEIQARMLGFDLATISDTGEVGVGFPGELICRKAFPIEPLGFWPLEGYGFSQEDVVKAKARFQESYFKDDSGLWWHGDYIQITPSRSGNGGGILMLGRSDGVLNPGGIRFGPTDIYSVLETKEFVDLGIEESLVVGLMIDGGADEKVVLFLKMRDGGELDEPLMKRVKTAIRLARSARHVPGKILQVSDIPVTLTGKKVEVPIRKIINGAPVSSINPATLRNPECLEEFVCLGEAMRKEVGM